MNPKHLAIFEPNSGGHHGLFIQHLLKFWGENQLRGTIELIVTPQFMKIHEQISHLRSTYGSSDIRISHIAPLPSIKEGSMRTLLLHDFRQGEALRKKLNQVRPSHTLLMYFDHLQISLGTSLRFIPKTHMAGIYFRPSFHYPIYPSSSLPSPATRQQVRKKVQLRLAMSNPNLRTLFSLDPYIVPRLNAMGRHTTAVALPDGVERLPSSTAKQRSTWGIQDNRFIAFCFGSLASRKGVFTLLDALLYLSSASQKRLALVFAGVVSEKDRIVFYSRVDRIRAQTNVQIIVDDRFVDDTEVQPMIRQSDLILVAYHHHIGSSNVLIRAAEAGIPVLGSNYGLIGAQIHDHGLGTAVDTISPQAVAAGLEMHMNQPGSRGYNPEKAKRFAASNDATLYAKTIFSTLGFV